MKVFFSALFGLLTYLLVLGVYVILGGAALSVFSTWLDGVSSFIPAFGFWESVAIIFMISMLRELTNISSVWKTFFE